MRHTQINWIQEAEKILESRAPTFTELSKEEQELVLEYRRTKGYNKEFNNGLYTAVCVFQTFIDTKGNLKDGNTLNDLYEAVSKYKKPE